MPRIVLWLGFLGFAVASICLAQDSNPLVRIQELRLRGELAEARTLAEKNLNLGQQDLSAEIELRLELARILDRVGLHHNSRPVAAALEQIEKAASLADEAGPKARAMTELALANAFYRIEMAEQKLPKAMGHANQAYNLFRELGDQQGEADAVHRLGLIHLQRRELEKARQLFDRSLELDQAAGQRLLFRGDYERHMGFVFYLQGNLEAALPFFERSLTFRREGGAIDQSLFAANMLASTLVKLERLTEARPPLLYAMMVAEQIGSLQGKTRNGLVLGQLYLQETDPKAAQLAFELALDLAQSIDSSSMTQEASEALEALRRQKDPHGISPPSMTVKD